LTRSSRTSRGWSGAALVAVLALGCAGLPLSPGGDDADRPRDLGREIRPNAPPEYDVLVGQQHTVDGRPNEALAAFQRAVEKDPESAYLHRLLADALARANRLDEAIEHATRALELDPDSRDTRTLLAHLHRIRRNPSAAEAVLIDASGEPYDVDAAFLLWQIYTESRRADDALRVAQWMVEQEPDDLRARISLAQAYEALGRPVDAERTFREALEIAPGNLRIYSALARSKRERGDREGEIAIYREVLDEYPDDHDTLMSLADAQIAAEDLEGAIGTLEYVERLYPGDLQATRRLGWLLYEARRFEGAVERFEHVLAEHPERHEVAFFLGLARKRAGFEEGAIAAFAGIPADHEHYADARTQIAAIYERRGEYAEALVELERALAVERSADLEIYGATLRAKAGDLEGAVAYMEERIAESPEDDELHYNLGLVYGEADRQEEALAAMQQALVLNPDNASALNYIGYIWAEQGMRLDEAEAMIRRAIELRPEDGYIVDSLGWVYYMRAVALMESGSIEEAHEHILRAISELERAEELTGGDPVIAEHLGDTYLLQGKRRLALDNFERAVGLGPREKEQPNLEAKLEALRREFE
jgi:tetratricopeptide (TPR) repeat protein